MEEGFMFRGCQLPPGFRFQPTDQEIIVYYLKKKITATAAAVTSIIADVDIYKFDPWELPVSAEEERVDGVNFSLAVVRYKLCHYNMEKAIFGEGEWFFFSPRDRKYPNGARPNRTAGSGYWKATGTDKPILAAGGAHCLGVKKALVFYQGRSPKGAKTEWVMHEYRLLDSDAAVAVAHHHRPNHSMRLDDWVLCRVRKKGLSSFAHDIDDAAAAAVPAPPPGGGAGYEMTHSSASAGDVDWTDGQLLQYLIAGSPQEHAGHAGGGASAAGHGHHHGDNTLVSVLESIKRNLSFQAIDELYLLQPSKRANFMIRAAGDDDDDQMSPTSFSISETDEVF
ncbi:hypothetical protein ACP4OV_020778 [Aristida adscensionis]